MTGIVNQVKETSRRETIADSSKQCYQGIVTEEQEKEEQRTHRCLAGDDGAAAVSVQ
jgi:hypothetical protein